ncbi:hypothetical protein MKW94_023049 [Papaver nudicaule]|uniref:Uncharacterized protein n=1 Tax=Papaver nudicaule TaxID=74823 RepID=A0AA41SEZ7_PAPNU|nr:hypothetical protein [Papaver nudicaule]
MLEVLSNDIDLLNPPAELEKGRHKLKRFVQSPNSFFMGRGEFSKRKVQIERGTKTLTRIVIPQRWEILIKYLKILSVWMAIYLLGLSLLALFKEIIELSLSWKLCSINCWAFPYSCNQSVGSDKTVGAFSCVGLFLCLFLFLLFSIYRTCNGICIRFEPNVCTCDRLSILVMFAVSFYHT